MPSKKKLTHTKKWKKLATIPGLRPALTGLFYKTKSNVGKINALYRKLEYQTRHPERFSTVRATSRASKSNLAGNPRVAGDRYVVPNFGYQKVRLVRHMVVREDYRKAGRESLIIRAREVVGPGAGISARVRALDPGRYARHKGRLMVQIGDRAPFLLSAYTGRHTGSGLARSSEYYLKYDQPEAVARQLEEFRWNSKGGLPEVEITMHIVHYERKPL